MKQVVLLFLIAFICFVPGELYAKFYRYIDKDGNLRFTDDISRVPPEYIIFFERRRLEC